jgi:hypothetical protein
MLLKSFFVEFIEMFLPEVLKYLDKESIEFIDKEIFTDPFSGEKYEADLLVKAKFKATDVYFLIHLENQAQDRPMFAKRMFKYFALFHIQNDLPVYPIALFSFESLKSDRQSSYNLRFPDKEVLKFSYTVIQLNKFYWKDYLKTNNPITPALMTKMNIDASDRVKAECLRIITSLKLKPEKLRILSGFVDTYLRLNKEEEKEFQAILEEFEPGVRKGVMEIVTSWKLEGLQEGLAHEQKVILKQLQKRFASVPSEVEEGVKKLDLDGLESFAEAIFDFANIDDVKLWLRK